MMKRQDVRWIAHMWRPHLGWLALILSLTFVSTMASVFLPLVLKRVFDGFAFSMTEDSLFRSAMLYLGVGTLAWLLAGCLLLLRGSMNLRFEWAARRGAYARLVRQSPAFFQRFRTGDLVTRLMDDVSDKLCWFLCSGILRTVAALAVIVFGVAMMVRLDPLLTLFTAGPLPVLIVLFIRTGTVLDQRFDAVQQRISRFNDGLEACFSGIRVVKAYGREPQEERSFDRLAVECRRSEIEAARSRTLIDSLYGQVWQLGVVAVLLAGGISVMNGRLTLGTFVAFDAYVLMLIFPMLDVGTFFVRGWQASVSIGRLRELEESPIEIVEQWAETRPAARIHSAIRGHLVFDTVSYSYGHSGRTAEASVFALSGVSFDVRPGQMIAIAGKVGSGKSTLLRLVPRLTDPTGGRLLLDGEDLRALPLAGLRAAIGYVPQEAVIFSGSIRENIRFAREGIGEEEILHAARAARLETDLKELPDGLETRVGVRGVTLSGGQKQRVALARALAARPRLLVLDDATAALDAETESLLWEELARACPDLAMLVVTHRCATLQRANRIIVMDQGRLAESGAHAELAKSGPLYRSIYRRRELEERIGLE